MNNLNIFCVTDKPIKHLEDLDINLVGVGERQFNQKYITCLSGKNIQKKERHYSELTFHYWYWKNILPVEKNHWVGFCQKRRFWIKSENNEYKISKDNLNNFLLDEINENFEFKLEFCEKEKDLKSLDNENSKDYLVISKKKISNLNKQIIIDKFPLNIKELNQILNINFLKSKFNEQSNASCVYIPKSHGLL